MRVLHLGTGDVTGFSNMEEGGDINKMLGCRNLSQVIEQGKGTARDLNSTDISNMPERSFKATTIRIFIELDKII